MKKRLGNYLKNKSTYFYVEAVVVIVILTVLIAIFVPRQINKIYKLKRNTDISNATLLGHAAENIIKSNDEFKNYFIDKLNVNKEVIVNSEDIDDRFINALIKELKGFKINQLPIIKMKKGGYTHFSISIDNNNNVNVYADNSDDTKDLQLYPKKYN
ncbi:hypothetical protein [Vallitalea sp.]|jgi:type II secretory pathway pseudopilin PulG|uniref:hypothetical protein n=1 Tax=Vallitalea sp. TaxID=1882829 RepID=UPI0025EDE4D6|nr:hypothetical protein [Vallitalea sp.]MCT4687087.1 hypothetical protein [Vallitalea sp.]